MSEDRAGELSGHIALVTGASRDIGAAIARLLASRSAAVAVNYVKSQAAAQSVVDQIVADGGKAIAVQADVGDEQQVAHMVQRVSQELGPIDTLVLNAAAVEHFTIKPFTEFQWPEFEEMVIGEIKGAFHPIKAVVPGMIERKHGSIIAISSGLSRMAMDGFSAHTTGKSALDGFMKSLALELGPHGIRANTVAPGFIETTSSSVWSGVLPGRIEYLARATPLRRLGQPEDVAGAVLMLASPQAQFITGAYLLVNGGNQMI